MNQRELFEAWAPPTSIWSPWAKPVLFAHMVESAASSAAAVPVAAPTLELSWAGSLDGGTAIILELPGAESVETGAALALRGFRPVPLFNTTPGPAPLVVDVRPIMASLMLYGPAMSATPLPDDALPAFMLDSLRLQSKGKSPGAYDNRWAVFEQDFPSATFLLARGIRQVLVVAPHGAPGPDLQRILSGWRRAGIGLLGRAAHGKAAVESITPREMLNWRLAAFAAMLGMGLRRNMAGGFGATIPTPSSSSGGGFS